MNSSIVKSALLFVIPLLLFSSCAQTEISKLDGNWRLFWINDLSDPDVYIWQFADGELTIIQFEPDNPNGATVAGRAQYETSSEFLAARVSISGHVQSASAGSVNSMISNGVWTIDKINGEVLRLSTTDQPGSGGSYIIREFTREN
ncbi:MAG TPA: hypothetical protein DCR04_08165 [Flavobacteriales bacterium]|nr:hypothetical protein [Flavobacteriales bacterium]